MTLRNTHQVSGMGSLKHLLLVLSVIVTLHVDISHAQCGQLPTDGNANTYQVKIGDQADTDEVTVNCLDGYKINDASSDAKTYDVVCETDTWQSTITETHCTDIDECADDDTLCGTGYCVNVPGSYVCVCDGVALHDNNDCDDYLCGSPPIDPNARRSEADKNPDDVVTYTCYSGFGVGGSDNDFTYTLDCDGTTGSWGTINTFCEDIDECDMDHICGEGFDSSCRNTYGSYICVCDYPGAASTSTGKCVESACGSVPIDPNAHLGEHMFEDNEVLTYDCDQGFVTDSGDTRYSLICEGGDWGLNSGSPHCSDRNECEEGIDSCDSNAECINQHGSYHCRCNQGYTGNGHTGNCDKVRCDVLSHIPNAVPTLTLPDAPEYENKVVYACNTGYEVSIFDGVSLYLQHLYEFTPNSFMVECLHTGRWSSWPMPYCTPVHCGDPGEVSNAIRTGGKFTYNTDVKYRCNEGYRLKSQVANPQEFSITCRSDGYWDSLQECTDIDECNEKKDICGKGVNYCLNTKGSYICSCAPLHIKSPEDRCIDTNGPACEIVKSLRLCINGECAMVDGQATCRCDEGWTGIGCDVKIWGIALIVAISALGCVILLLVFACASYICHTAHRHKHLPPPVCLPPLPAVPNPTPHLETMRLPKAPPRYPGWGSVRFGGGKENGLRRTPDNSFGTLPFH